MPGSWRRAVPALLLALTFAGLAAGAAALRSYDLGWHLRAGDWILEHGGAPPRRDVLSFTSADAAWVDHEWLFQVLLAGSVRVLGPAGAWGLKQLLVLVATLVPAGWLLWRGTSPLVVAMLTCVALEGARFRFSERPEMAGLALLPIVLILLAEWERGRAGPVVIGAVPILVALWANLHPSALLAAGLVGVWVVGSTLVPSAPGAPRAGLRWTLLGLVAVALLANPWGPALLRVPFAIRDALAGEGIANPEWGHSVRAEFWFFWVTLAALGGAAARAWRRGGRPRLPGALLLLGLAVAGGAALRLIGFFFVALPVLVPLAWRRGTPEPVSPPARAISLPGATRLALLLPLLAGTGFLLRPAGAPLGAGLAPGRFPEAMARAWTELGVRGPMYNPVRFGGYLSWALAPERVFLDGRNEIHGPLLRRLAACRGGPDPRCQDRLLDEYGVEAAVVEYDDRPVTVGLPDGSRQERTTTSVWFRRSRWALIDWDDTALLYVKRAGANAELAARHEDRWLMPEDPGVFEADWRAGRVAQTAARIELAKRRARRPDCRRLERLARIMEPSQ